MNIFDLDKNSLPEQVQINKDDIKDIKENLMPADLQAAKDYTDNHMVDNDHIDSGTATAGQILTADGNGGASWDTPSTTVTASDVDSETATAGQVLAADGNGGASWQTVAAGGGCDLLWSGSVDNNLALSNLANPITDYKYILIEGSVLGTAVNSYGIIVNVASNVGRYVIYCDDTSYGYLNFIKVTLNGGDDKLYIATSKTYKMSDLSSTTNVAIRLRNIYGIK